MPQLAFKPGDLVLTTNYVSEKVHIAFFMKFRSKRHSGEELSESQANMFVCEPLCNMRSQDKYYWQAHEESGLHRGDEHKCKACFAGWNRRGKPLVLGLTDDEVPVDHPKLAFAWKEVPAVGHPTDKGKEKDDDDDPRDVDEQPRKELRRWARGRRYVRLVEFKEGDYTHGIFVGFEKLDRIRFRGPLGKCLMKISVIMAMGGDT